MGNKIEQFRRLHTTPIKRIERFLNYINELNLKYNYQMFTFDNQFLPMMDFDKVNALMPSLGGSIIKQPDNHNESIYSKYTIAARNAYLDWCYCRELLSKFQMVLTEQERVAVIYKYLPSGLSADYTIEQIYSLCDNIAKYYRCQKKALEKIAEALMMDAYEYDGITLNDNDICYAERKDRTGYWGGYVKQ